MKTEKNGFTLIELLIAMAITAILSSIVVINYQHLAAKAKAAQISTHLHKIEDAIFTAIIDGRTVDDFGARITGANVGSSVLAPYLSRANLKNVSSGIEIKIMASRALTPGHFYVFVSIKGEKGTERILDELEKMFPKTMSHKGNLEWVVVDSSKLQLKPKGR